MEGEEGNRGRGAEPGEGEEEPGRGDQNCKPPALAGEIAFFGGMTIVYKSSIDLFLYVVGSSYENEVSLGGFACGRLAGGVCGQSWEAHPGYPSFWLLGIESSQDGSFWNNT